MSDRPPRPQPPPPSNTAVDANKAIGGGLASGLTIVIVWLLGTWGGVSVPPEVASAFTALIGTAGTWLTPHSS